MVPATKPVHIFLNKFSTLLLFAFMYRVYDEDILSLKAFKEVLI